MNKTTIKIFTIVFLIIMIPLWGLIEFQKITQEKEISNFVLYSKQSDFLLMKPQEPPKSIPFILISVLASFMTLLFVKYLSNNFINPLKDIQEKTKQISNGNFDVNFDNNYKNQSVIETFNILNTMLLSIKEKQLIQEGFIQSLTHDLRAPVLIQDKIYSLLENEISNNNLVDLLRKNNENYLKLINLIIENYTAFDTPMKNAVFNLKEVVLSIYSVLKPVFIEKNLNFNINIDEKYFIFADYSAVNRILLNLISNAVEDIDDNKTITVEAKITSQNYIILVSDNGRGIPSEFLPYIFEKNASLHQTGQKAVRGLGLNICKNLITRMNGKIYVETKLNEYTRFIIELPKGNKNE